MCVTTIGNRVGVCFISISPQLPGWIEDNKTTMGEVQSLSTFQALIKFGTEM